jgi:hypothetical protein
MEEDTVELTEKEAIARAEAISLAERAKRPLLDEAI